VSSQGRCRRWQATLLFGVAVAVARQPLPAWAFADEEAPSSQGDARSDGRREFNIFPVVGGDSDVGIGFGQISDWARLSTTPASFRWRLEDATFVTFKLRDSTVIVPFLDLYILFTVPHFGPSGRLRLEVRPSFTDERTLGYYGIGNASLAPPGTSTDQEEYRRMHPTLAGKLRVQIVDGWFVAVADSLTLSLLDVAPDTLLARDQNSGSTEVRQLLGKFSSHTLNLLEVGTEYDTRDNETVTSHGQYHALSVRYSPALAWWMPYSYVQFNATLRFYATPIPRWLSISFRFVGDAIAGTAPFYELARFDDTPAIGGGKAIRGVPAQRYHGKVKVFENFEIRSDLLPFTVKKKALVLGLAAFLDAGRTWTELFHAHPELDGSGLGIKYGVGCGLRLQEGKTFVVRADLAWSPDARPVGGYFAAGEIF